MRDEHRLDIALSRFNGKATASFPWGPLNVEMSSLNLSAGGRGSPDGLLPMRLGFDMLGQQLSAQLPVLVEAEKGGVDAAVKDLDRFAERSLRGEPPYLLLPMLVISRSHEKGRRTEMRHVRARFDIQSAPLSPLDR